MSLQRLVAIRDIMTGEELSICYLGLTDRMSPVEDRRRLLLQYGLVLSDLKWPILYFTQTSRFDCECGACSLELSDSTSGHYIQRYRQLRQTLTTLDGEDIINVHLEINGLLEDHNCKVIWRIRNLEEALALDGISNEIINQLERLRTEFTIFFTNSWRRYLEITLHTMEKVSPCFYKAIKMFEHYLKKDPFIFPCSLFIV